MKVLLLRKRGIKVLNTPRPKASFIKYCSPYFSTLKSIFSQLEAGKPDERLFAGNEGRPKQVAVMEIKGMNNL